jgi:hypothetical protein
MRFARFYTPGDKDGLNMAINLDQVSYVEVKRTIVQSEDPEVLEAEKAVRLNFNMVSGQVLNIPFSSMDLARRVLNTIAGDGGMRINTAPKERQKN